MDVLLGVILPVFFVISFGYISVWLGWFSKAGVDGLNKFTQQFAFPCMLFTVMAKIDVSQNFHFGLLISFYAGAVSGFLLGFLGAHYIFGRSIEDAIAIGFCGLFSNTVMLGLPISERAYGIDALNANFAIIAVHAPFCYALGITVMEIAKNRNSNHSQKLNHVLSAMFKNALVIGIFLGLIVNVTGIVLPIFIWDGMDLLIRAALPAALFGLGGVLYFYRPEGDFAIIAMIVFISLIVHPIITYALGSFFELELQELRSAVITAAMAPGVNAYVFSNLYGRAQRVAASSVLIATALTVLTAWFWLEVVG